MIVTTTPIIQGYKIKKYIGLIRGIMVRTPTITQNLQARIKSVIGGKMGALRDMCDTARQEAYDHMIEEAQKKGANAIIGVGYDGSEISTDGTEIVCYGTAVIVEPERQENFIISEQDESFTEYDSICSYSIRKELK